MADKEVLVVNPCGYCSKNVDFKSPKCVKCVNCEAFYHMSCSQRVKNVKTVENQPNSIVCCSVEQGPKELTPTGNSCSMASYHQMENQYLKALIAEKDARILELITLNKLLQEKYEDQNKVAGQTLASTKQRNHKKLQIETKIVSGNKTLLSTDKNGKQKHSSGNVNKNIDVGGIVDRQSEIMNELIHLTDPTPTTIENQRDDEFKVVVGRKHKRVMSRDALQRRQRNETKGTAKTDPGDPFKARPRKMWLFVGRADDSVSVDTVRAYIANKCTVARQEELYVRKLSSVGKAGAFQVGIDPAYYEMVNVPEFWPSGIVVRRFNFNYRGIPEQSITQKENMGFLGVTRAGKAVE